MVWIAHHRLSPMLGKFFGSVKWIATAATIVTETVTDAMIRAARGAVNGCRNNTFTARGCAGGGAAALPSGGHDLTPPNDRLNGKTSST
jgi:hypothetical protein